MSIFFHLEAIFSSQPSYDKWAEISKILYFVFLLKKTISVIKSKSNLN